jgi:hypothetical protein
MESQRQKKWGHRLAKKLSSSTLSSPTTPVKQSDLNPMATFSQRRGFPDFETCSATSALALENPNDSSPESLPAVVARVVSAHSAVRSAAVAVSTCAPSEATVTPRGTDAAYALLQHGIGRVSERMLLLAAVSDVSAPLALRTTESGFMACVSDLPYNAICIELRDLYRILQGLEAKAHTGLLTIEDVTWFYEWFKGFCGIVTCVFEVEEDIVFSWLENVGAIRLENSLAQKRRKTKQNRVRDVCLDILELNLSLQKKATSKVSLVDLVYELADEVDLLASRLLMYVHSVDAQLPSLMSCHFERTEREMIERAMIRNLKASQQGKFVLSSFARGISSPASRESFLEASFGGPKAERNAGVKTYRKFFKMHVDIANRLSNSPSALNASPVELTIEATLTSHTTGLEEMDSVAAADSNGSCDE